MYICESQCNMISCLDSRSTKTVQSPSSCTGRSQDTRLCTHCFTLVSTDSEKSRYSEKSRSTGGDVIDEGWEEGGGAREESRKKDGGAGEEGWEEEGGAGEEVGSILRTASSQESWRGGSGIATPGLASSPGYTPLWMRLYPDHWYVRQICMATVTGIETGQSFQLFYNRRAFSHCCCYC